MKLWLVGWLIACGGATAAAADWLERPQADSELGRSVRSAFRPAFEAVESLSDGVYDFMRARVAGTLLPAPLARGMARAPREDSYARFTRHLETREARYVERARQTYPVQDAGGRLDQRRLNEWRGWAIEQQQNVVWGALERTLFERYAMDRFAKSSGDYALKPGAWDAGFLTTFGLFAGALVYANGLHTDAVVNDWRVAVDIRSGNRLRQAIQSGDDARGLAAVEIGPAASPWSASAEWGARDGELLAERFGVNYRVRF